MKNASVLPRSRLHRSSSAPPVCRPLAWVWAWACAADLPGWASAQSLEETETEDLHPRKHQTPPSLSKCIKTEHTLEKTDKIICT